MESSITTDQLRQFVTSTEGPSMVDDSLPASLPRISIVTACLNPGPYFRKAMNSLRNQRYPNLEFIVIDGGSTDGTIELIKENVDILSYWVSEPDKGQSDALNKAFARVQGDIMAILDADDIYLPGAFESVVDTFRRFPGADFVFGNRLDIDADDSIIGEMRYTRFSPLVYRYDGMAVAAQSTFWRTSWLKKLGLLDCNLHFTMDYEYFLRANAQGARFVRTPAFLAAMRMHQGSKTTVSIGTPVHQKECAEVDEKYGRKRWFNIPLKIYSLFYRAIGYCLQGDYRYVLDGILRRWRGDAEHRVRTI